MQVELLGHESRTQVDAVHPVALRFRRCREQRGTRRGCSGVSWGRSAPGRCWGLGRQAGEFRQAGGFMQVGSGTQADGWA